jgi:hypothetical protein
MTSSITELIDRLHLISHPEGGWYRETYRSTELMSVDNLPERFSGDRSFCTAIYFLLGRNDVSALHRIKSDEIWHFYSGASITVHIFTPQGDYRTRELGPGPAAAQTWQTVVPAGCWFGAELSGKGEYGLVGCTVSPGFDFTDFEMAGRDELLKLFPEQAGIINRLCRA